MIFHLQKKLKGPCKVCIRLVERLQEQHIVITYDQNKKPCVFPYLIHFLKIGHVQRRRSGYEFFLSRNYFPSNGVVHDMAVFMIWSAYDKLIQSSTKDLLFVTLVERTRGMEHQIYIGLWKKKQNWSARQVNRNFDLTHPSDRTNPAVIMDSAGHDPSDPKVRNKWLFIFQVCWITAVINPIDQTNRYLVSLW